VVATIGSLTERIRDYNKRIERVCEESYPEETGLLRQVPGVGALTSLTFVLTLEDPRRFEKSRSVGAYLWVSCPARTSPVRVTPASGSPGRAMRCCGGFW
jgi:transposase